MLDREYTFNSILVVKPFWTDFGFKGIVQSRAPIARCWAEDAAVTNTAPEIDNALSV